MRIIKANIEQITPRIDAKEYYKAIEIVARTCYKSEHKITDGSSEKLVKRLIDSGHHAMIEHAPVISMRFICDRGVSHELVRHRLFSFAQESTRYCNYSKNDVGLTFILPSWFDTSIIGEYRPVGDCRWKDESSSPEIIWFNACADAERYYLYLLKEGWSPQQARSILPNSLKTEIVITGNLREWRHFFGLRLAKDAHPQMKEVAWQAFDMLYEQIPLVLDDIRKMFK